MELITIGLDIAKNVFQVHGVDASGKQVVSARLRRERVEKYFAALPRCLVVMEACGSAHHWARIIGALGHETRLVPAAYVKPFVKRNKTDARDAEAICEAALRPHMRFVAVKSVEQQSARALHRARDLLVRQRTQLGNCLRGLLAEMGVVAAQGAAGLAALLRLVEAGEDPRVPASLYATLQALTRQWRAHRGGGVRRREGAVADDDPGSRADHGACGDCGDRRRAPVPHGARFRRLGRAHAARIRLRREAPLGRRQPRRRRGPAASVDVGRERASASGAGQARAHGTMAFGPARSPAGARGRRRAGRQDGAHRLGDADDGRELSGAAGDGLNARQGKEHKRRNGKMVGNLGRNTPTPQCAAKRVILIGIRSAKPLWASGHAPREQAGYMTAPNQAETLICPLRNGGRPYMRSANRGVPTDLGCCRDRHH